MRTELGFATNRLGRDHLEQRSRLKKQLSEMPRIAGILIVDDSEFDANVLASTLRLVFDPDIRVRQVRFLRDIRKAIIDEPPELLFLDDRLGHGASAEVSLTTIRAAHCACRPIVLSGLLTRSRQIELLKMGFADVVHKDDVNVVRISEAILKALDRSRP